MSIKLKIEGFEELLKEIETAGGSINKSCEVAIKQSANIMQEELKSQMQTARVKSRLINSMPQPTIEVEGNQFSAQVGYKKGEYDPQNLSDAYKVVFLNYGTPNRTKHGKVKARGFIQKAKKKAKPRIKKEQERAFNEILGRLQR